MKDILTSIHVLLTPDEEHPKVFQKVPLVGFRRGKNLKDILVRAKLLETQSADDSGKWFCKRCGVYYSVQETNSFSDKDN